MKKCEYCNKEYKLNENIADFLPKAMQEKIKYIPDCDCYEKIKQKELAENEKLMRVERVRNKVKKYKDISIIDSKFEKSTFKNANMEERHMRLCKNFTDKFVARGTSPMGLLMSGTVGTGKTYASACISNELMDNGKTVLIMQLGLYLNKLKREWAEAEHDVLKSVKDCDLLVIDDFGTEKVTEFVIEKTFNLIDTRYRAEKPTIITTNLNKTELASKFGQRIADRISEMTFEVIVQGESKRRNAKVNEFLEFIA